MRRLATLAILCCLGLAPGTPTALAQYDDEQTRDHEEQDRLYLERRQEEPAAEPSAADAESVEGARGKIVAEADRLIRDRNHRATDSDHFRVQSDDPRLTTDGAAELLEEFRGYFERFWGARLDLAAYDEVSRVYLFYSFHKFNQLLQGDYRYRSARPKGHYDTWIDLITLHTDADGPDGLANALVHEAAHQLIDQRIYSGGYAPSIWISEGLAAYFGFTYREAQGGFRPGAVGGKSIELLSGEKGGGNEARANLENARGAIRASRKSGTLATATVISIGEASRFYDDNASLNYAVAWAVVHTLLHGQEGALANRFIGYLKLESSGAGGPEVLYRELELEPQDLESAVAAHVKSLKAR